MSYKGQKQIDSFQAGGNREGLNFGQIKSFKIPLPPLPEQKAIARVLSDVDELIRECDTLLAKKLDIKQRTMQQLLTGKKRLPGFTGEWKEKKLGEIGKFKNGINKDKDSFGFECPFVNLLDIFGKNKLHGYLSLGLINSTKNERGEYELKKGDVLFVRSSVKSEGVGLTSVIIENLDNTVYSGFLIRFRDFKILSLEYKAYCFYEENFRKRLIDNSTVSANTNINQEALKELTIFFPTLP
ncbi:MAG: restriction endonuclease subunit S [Cyanobacteria bacterium P01_A01_bin.40]